MNMKRIIIPLLLIILLAYAMAFGSNVPLGPYFDDTYFDISGSALILKVVPHEKGGLEADISAYDGLIKITGGATSNLTIGIGDDNIVEIDDADAAVDDYCKLTANGIVGRSYFEVKTDLGIDLSLYYLKTEMDSFSELQAIISDKTLVNTENKLSDFATTTSAELAGAISNETGSGLLVYGTSPNITTPTGIIKGDVGLDNVENLKVKLDGTQAPTVDNDIDEGYAVGSRWADVTNDREYVCLDNTDGEAVWTETTKTIALLSTTTTSFAADADTTLYTVPTGKRCVLSHAIVVAAGDAGATTTLSIGQDTAETDFIPANTLSNLDAQYDSVILQPIPNTTPLQIKSYAAATVIEAQVASHSGVADNTIYLFGILY